MKQLLMLETIIGQLVAGTELTVIPIPLKKTTIQGQVVGPLANIQVSQVFTNPLDDAAEMDYLFPLPEKAAITDFELRIGERVISAEIEELEQARKIFEEANQQGKRAGLFEQRRPNLFAVRLTNVLPGETIQTRLSYQSRLKFEDGAFELVFPMALTPRYNTPDHPEEARQTEFPVASPGSEIGPVNIDLMIDSGAAVADPTSPTHPLKIARIDEHRFQVTLEGKHIPDHDFVLRYALANEDPTACAWNSHDESGDYLLAAVFPPALPEDYQAPPREFIFVLDRSGSMTGEPVKQARNALRACLRTLNQGDTFRILLFDDKVEWFNQAPSAITQAEIDRADSYLEQAQGRGGTEILGALEAAFSKPEDPSRSRYIVFLTDGAVSAEERALQQIRKKLGKARLFTFGIGPSVNRAFLSQMAGLGHGTAEFLQMDEDIEGSIIRFQDRVSFPVLTNLSLAWEGVRTWDVYPASLPDLYAGQPLEVCCRFQSIEPSTALILSGSRDGAQVKMRLEIQPVSSNEETIRRVWCKARIDDLLEKMESQPEEISKVRNEIISLALQSRLVTPFTAFVAVDQEMNGMEVEKRKYIHVAQPLPKGLDRNGFGGAVSGAPEKFLFMASAPIPPQPAASMANQKSRLFDDLDVPAFLRKKSDAVMEEKGKAIFQEEVGLAAEDDLNWLARTQDVDGSWGQDIERTSAALLAFMRNGYTTRTGSFRQTIKRAFAWLADQSFVTGMPAFVRCLALNELAQMTRQPAHLDAARTARSTLARPISAFERAALSLIEADKIVEYVGAEEISNLEELRLAAILKRQSKINSGIIKGPIADLMRTWMAVLP